MAWLINVLTLSHLHKINHLWTWAWCVVHSVHMSAWLKADRPGWAVESGPEVMQPMEGVAHVAPYDSQQKHSHSQAGTCSEGDGTGKRMMSSVSQWGGRSFFHRLSCCWGAAAANPLPSTVNVYSSSQEGSDPRPNSATQRPPSVSLQLSAGRTGEFRAVGLISPQWSSGWTRLVIWKDLWWVCVLTCDPF